MIDACRAFYAAIEAFDHHVAEAAGISRNDLRALNLLEHEPLSAGALASELQMTSGAVTTLIDRMESKGLVKRKANPDDRRAVLVSPTPKLFRTLGKVYMGVAKQMDQSTAELSEVDQNVSINTLNVVTKAYRNAAEKA